MITTVNYVYYFTMSSTLSALDGIYRVSSILSYSEMVDQNLDLYELTYKPNSLTEEVFNSDLETVRIEKIMKLISVTDSTIVLYIPEHFFATIPDGSVQKYLQLGLAINLGVFADADQLSSVRSEVEQVVEAMAGVSNKTKVFTVNSTWMTTADYETIDTARKAAITRTSNHFTDKVELVKQVDSLKTLIKYYEDTLKSLG